MKNIESQISAIISFQNVELKDIEKHAANLDDRISIGLEKMKSSNFFTDEEIKQISSFAYKLLTVRTNDCRDRLIADARSKFIF